MHVSLDTNVWIFGLKGTNHFCEVILFKLGLFRTTVGNQIRAELERNLSAMELREFYQLVLEKEITIDFAPVSRSLVAAFERKGLKKGDAVIGTFCDWRNIDIFVSHNRDFLRGLAPDHRFTVLSPQQFCEQFELQ